MTRRPIPVLFGALGVLAFFLVRDLVTFLLTLAHWTTSRFDNVALAFPTFFQYLVAELPGQVLFSAGVFLCWWLLLPITASIGLASTIVRGVMAAFAGGLVAVLGGTIAWLVGRLASGVRVGDLYDVVPMGLDPGSLVIGEVGTVFSLLPLTVLAAVLVREWLRSRAAVEAPKEPVEAV